MDLPQIGAHCSHSSCNVLDFLPITCSCGAIYCSQHISPDHHACPNLTTKQKVTLVFDKIPRCTFAGCSKPSLQIYSGNANETCSGCHKSFCAEHRHAETHLCSLPSLQDAAAQEKKSSATPVKPSLPPAFSLPKRKPPKDPVKLAQWQKVETMKMRHQASPADPKDKMASLPPDQRLHIRLLMGGAEKVFWFRKTIIAGRALDLLAAQQIPTLSRSEPLQLCKLLEGPEREFDYAPLRNDQLLENQIQDGDNLAIRSLP